MVAITNRHQNESQGTEQGARRVANLCPVLGQVSGAHRTDVRAISLESGRDYTQRHPQTPDFLGNQQSSSDTQQAGEDQSKVVYPQEFWHNQTPLT
jgi:hypothetical protein